MAKTVEQIRQQIAKLQEREKSLLQKEAIGVVARIKEAVAHYGITPEQIFGASEAAKPAAKRVVTKQAATKRVVVKKAGGARKSAAKVEGAAAAGSTRGPSPAKGIKVAPKFSDGAGNSWTGRGSQPRWLRAAIEGGKSLQDFAVA